MFLRSISERQMAEQLASLLNKHNRLGTKKVPGDFFGGHAQYIVETHGRLVIGACCVEKQGYTFTEIKHLVVDPQWRGKGLGRFLVKRALFIPNTPLIYATIREGNQASIKLFQGLGFSLSASYQGNQHKVLLFTKVNELWKKEPLFSLGSDLGQSPPAYSLPRFSMPISIMEG